jgi:hypothetical protein
MRNVQRPLKSQHPRTAEVILDGLLDNRYIGKLDESGFFDRIYISRVEDWRGIPKVKPICYRLFRLTVPH